MGPLRKENAPLFSIVFYGRLALRVILKPYDTLSAPLRKSGRCVATQHTSGDIHVPKHICATIHQRDFDHTEVVVAKLGVR